MMEQGLRALWHRVLLMVGRGRVATVDDAGPVQLHQLSLLDDETKDATPYVLHYGFACSPPPGTDAVAVFVGGERTNGVVIATNNRTYRLKGLANGDVALYDNRGQVVRLTDAGIKLEAPVVECTQVLKVGVGASGTFTTPTGQVVTVQDGIVTNISA